MTRMMADTSVVRPALHEMCFVDAQSRVDPAALTDARRARDPAAPTHQTLHLTEFVEKPIPSQTFTIR
jgi:hypothetical protein